MKTTQLIAIFFAILILASCADNHKAEIPSTTPPQKTDNFKNNSPMDTINTDEFWTLVDNAVNAANGNNDLKEDYLVEALKKRSLEEIIQFEIAFRKCVIDADHFNIMAAQKIIEGYVSDDSYLYFRCWLIGQGKAVYAETLKNPDYLATIASDGDEHEWEGLMYLATEAYAKKTGKEEDETFPRDVATQKGLDYDFGAPPTKGTDWTEEQLPTLLPKLWEKFN